MQYFDITVVLISNNNINNNNNNNKIIINFNNTGYAIRPALSLSLSLSLEFHSKTVIVSEDSLITCPKFRCPQCNIKVR